MTEENTRGYDSVNHPQHYVEGFWPVSIECIDITRHMPFCTGNAFKYVWRAGRKGGPEKMIEDLQKALWYLNDALTDAGFRLTPAPPAAQSVFDLLPADTDSRRYLALRDIVRGNLHLAMCSVQEWAKTGSERRSGK